MVMNFRALLPSIAIACAATACMSASGRGTVPESNTCAKDAGWDSPKTPQRIFGDTWYVGTCGISAVLVTSDAGHVVIDGGTGRGGELVLTSIRSLGFEPADIRYILNTHAHVDHAGGLAVLQRASGAPVLAHRDAVATLERGNGDASDPQFGALPAFAPVAKIVPFEGEKYPVQFGDFALVAHATPGHAAGGTSWTWTSCEKDTCQRMAFVDSLSAVSAKGYRFSAQPALLATFRSTFDRVDTLPCDVLLTPHPSASRMWQRLGPAASEPLVDAQACRRYADAARTRLAERLADEAAGRAP